MLRLRLRTDRAPRFRSKAIPALLLGLFSSSFAIAQEETPAPLVDRELTGTADLGDFGRFVGPALLGTVNVSSNALIPDAEGETPTARSITINQNGFAWTSSGLLLRNGSDSDIVFGGSNSVSQNHDLEVYYFGTGGGPRQDGQNVALGEFSIENFSLGGDPTNLLENSAGDSVQTFGGFFEQSAVLRNASGNDVTFRDRGSNPFDESGSIANSTANITISRTTSTAPSALPSALRPIFAAPSFRVDDESLPLQRTDALFEVEPLASENTGQLDLSAIDISVSGQSVVDRSIGGGTVGLGRFIREDSTIEVQRDDTVTLRTSGTDATRTRLSLDAFNVGGDDQVSAVLANQTDFNSESSTAEVNLSGTFSINRDEIGTFFAGQDVGTSITGENLAGENTQGRLNVGYTYGVVDNNDVVSEDVTVFKIGNFDTTGEVISNNTIEREFSTRTHTELTIDERVILDNSAVQSVSLSEGNGITGEGLDGEDVSAETTFNVHTLQIAPSQLVTSQGQVGEGDEITIENTASPGELTSTAFLVSSERSGSNRWFFPPSGPRDLEAGESVTLTPTFDETGLDDSIAEGSLGLNFRTQFSVGFQDGRFLDDEDAVAGTQLADQFSSQFSSRFDILGSEETRQQFDFVVERAIEQEAISGSLTLATGVSLRDTGINLTNASDNTTAGFTQTSVEILDGFVASAEGIDLNVEFASVDNALESEAAAVGFDSLRSDIARIEGLDGLLHTLQLNFSVDDEIPIDDASLLWFDEGVIEDAADDAWVNAILGNSDITSYDLDEDLVLLDGDDEAIALSEFLDSRRVELSYTDYLLSLEEGQVAELGVFGFDLINGVAWAVIDHNSSFATTTAVPEPSTGICLIAGLLLSVSRRRRSQFVG